MRRIVFVFLALVLVVAAAGAQSLSPTLSDEQVAALRYAYDRSIAPRGKEKPAFEVFAQATLDRLLSGIVSEYRAAQKKTAAADIAKIDASVCQKLDTATKELLAKALDGRAFCGVSAPLDAAVAVESTR